MEEVGSTRLTSLERVTIRTSGRFLGALGRNLTSMAYRCDLRYWMVRTPVFLLNPLPTRPETNANGYPSQLLNRDLNGKQNTTQILRLECGKLAKSGSYSFP